MGSWEEYKIFKTEVTSNDLEISIILDRQRKKRLALYTKFLWLKLRGQEYKAQNRSSSLFSNWDII